MFLLFLLLMIHWDKAVVVAEEICCEIIKDMMSKLSKSCGTENWNNDAENPANKLHLQNL